MNFTRFLEGVAVVLTLSVLVFSLSTAFAQMGPTRRRNSKDPK